MANFKSLDNDQQSTIIILRNTGISQTQVADEYKVSVDTIRRLQKLSPEYGAFKKDEDGFFKLADPTQVLSIPGDLILSVGSIVTGNPEDGIVEVNRLYTTDCEVDLKDQSSVEDALDVEFIAGDVGVLGKVKIGGFFHRSKTLIEASTATEVAFESKKYVKPSKEEPIDAGEGEVKFYPNPYLTKTVKEEKIEPVAKAVEPTKEPEQPKLIWNASSKFISITQGTKIYNADKDHPNFKKALQLLIDDRVEEALDLINVERGISRYAKGNIKIENGQLFYKGVELRSGLVTRILSSMENGENFEFYIPFLENLMLNPSNRAVLRLFDFLTANDIEITSDGHFLAWKVVTSEFKDCHTRTFDNSPGTEVRVERNQVDDRDEVTCSHGLHVCARSYISVFSSSTDKLVKVKVNPVDVVSVPVDYGDAKMRCCGYLVLEEVKA